MPAAPPVVPVVAAVATVAVGALPESVMYDPGNGYVYAGNYTGNTVSVINPSATMTCTATFTPSAGTPAGTYTMSASFSEPGMTSPSP